MRVVVEEMSLGGERPAASTWGGVETFRRNVSTRWWWVRAGVEEMALGGVVGSGWWVVGSEW